MAIQQHTVQLKLRDGDWKTLGVSQVESGSVVCVEGLVEGADFEVDHPKGLIRRLRVMGDAEQGLFTFTFNYEDGAEAAAAAAADAEALRQQIIALAQSAVGVTLSALTTAQRSALTACLLWKAGGVTNDMKVKALADWLK